MGKKQSIMARSTGIRVIVQGQSRLRSKRFLSRVTATANVRPLLPSAPVRLRRFPERVVAGRRPRLQLAQL